MTGTGRERRYASVLFDLDGTLVDSARAVAGALNGLAAERDAPPVSVAAVRGWISLGADALVANALGRHAADPGRDLARMRELLAGAAHEPGDVFPGVAAALAALHGAGLALAVVTNKPQGLSERLLTDLGLARWFGAVVGGDRAGRSKPHPAPLRLALAEVGGAAASTCLVGDSAVDAAAAAALGIPFYLFEAGYDAAGCADQPVAARFARFAQLPALLAAA